MARYPLPYTFARSNQALLESDESGLTLWMSDATPRSAIAEIMRKHGFSGINTAQSAIEKVAPDALIQRISAAYAQGESSAASVVTEVQGDADLSQIGRAHV